MVNEQVQVIGKPGYKLMKYIGSGQWKSGKVLYRNRTAAENAAAESKKRSGLRCIVIKFKKA